MRGGEVKNNLMKIRLVNPFLYDLEKWIYKSNFNDLHVAALRS